MDTDIVCNFKKCRKHLTSFAWVTSCSHIFCNEHGTKEFATNTKCPACGTDLENKYDIIRIDPNPTEQYKSMVLAGQRPDVILDACSRAMSFWIYQIHQEITYQEYISSKSKDRVTQMEQLYQQAINKAHCDVSALRCQLETIKKEMELQKHKNCQLSEKLTEKDRQYKKLMATYEVLRRRCISPAQFDNLARRPNFRNAQAYRMPLTTADDILHPLSAGISGEEQNISNDGFTLAPVMAENPALRRIGKKANNSSVFNISFPMQYASPQQVVHGRSVNT